jgi:hypothetical protein
MAALFTPRQSSRPRFPIGAARLRATSPVGPADGGTARGRSTSAAQAAGKGKVIFPRPKGNSIIYVLRPIAKALEDFKVSNSLPGLRPRGFRNMNIPNLKRVVTRKKYFAKEGRKKDMKSIIDHEEVVKKLKG